MKFVPKKADGNVNVPKINQGVEFLWMVAAVFAFVSILYVLLGFAVDLAAPHIPAELESKIGAGYAKSFDDGKRDETEKELERIMSKLLSKAPPMPYDFKIHIVYAPDANALALPGGNIVIFSGILNKVKSENEIAFVLAHELGHYEHRDHLRGVGRAFLVMMLSAIIAGGGDSGAGRIAEVIIPITTLKFSRDQEKKADLFALELLQDVYGHIGGYSHLFERMKKLEKMPEYAYFFATHPGFGDRIATLRAAAVERGYNEGRILPLAPALKNVSEGAAAKGKKRYGF